MLPMTLLAAGAGTSVLVEVKSGETYNGLLERTDYFMNLHLKDVVCTSADGRTFQRMTDCYVRGNSLKYLRFPKTTYEAAVRRGDTKPASRGRSRGTRRRGIPRGRGGPRSTSNPPDADKE